MIILPAILEKYGSLKDKSHKVTFETQEMTPDQVVGLNENLGNFGWLAFKEDTFKQSEKDILEGLESDYQDKGKTPSQRLRGVLYRYWEQDSQGYEDFNLYYNFQLEKIITHFKGKLDD